MNLNSILGFLNSGGFLAALFIFGYGVKKIIDVAQVIVDHTKTKADNEVLDKIKAFAKTAVTAAQALPVPGNEQMDASKKSLIQWANLANYDLSDDEAQKFAEEQYQLIFGQHKATVKVSDTPEQKQLLETVQESAEKVDPANYPIPLANGDHIEINHKQFKLSTDDAGKIYLTPEGK
ncbi:MAG: hypothetical protein LIV28_03185 [Lactobacillus sp.]|jgi:hypothetical protein|nr:hypothetical protein [Lactobacillus sp.]